LRIERGRAPVHIPGNKAQSLFAFLILHPDTPHTRESLASLLWPDAPPDRVRRNLAGLLHRLRKALGPAWLTVEGNRIALRTGPDLWVDAWEFERLSAAEDAAVLQHADALYCGELLPELYDDWILPHRIALHEQYLTCLLRLGQMAEQQDDLQAAAEHFRRLVHADPLREEGHRGLMRSLATPSWSACWTANWGSCRLRRPARWPHGFRPNWS
jgi:DNA-binding SARP family transcriptional activator